MTAGSQSDAGPPRRFEMVAGGAAKFWEASLTATGHRVRFGKLGTHGQTRDKAIADPDEARRALDKLIAEKLAHGYVEVADPAAVTVEKPGLAPGDAGDVPDWTTVAAWRTLFGQIKTSQLDEGTEVATASDADLDAFEAEMQFRLPLSYRAYMKVFGSGQYGSSHHLYAPGKLGLWYARDLIERQKEFERDVVRDQDYVSERGSKIEPIRHMIIFGEDIAPTQFGWDLEDVRNPDAHEYAIRHFDDEYDSCPVIAASFPEFIHDFVLARCWKQAKEDESYADRSFYHPDARAKGWAAKHRKKIKANPPPRPAKSSTKGPAKPRSKRSPIEERQLMLAAVVDPNDPDPWLAYADWLDGFKDKFGALIRLRFGGPEAVDPEREAKLIAGLEKPWSQRDARAGLLPAVFDRLHQYTQIYYDDDHEIYHLRLLGEMINARVLAILSTYPALRFLEISEHQLTRAEVETLARIQTLRELWLHSGTTNEDLAVIARIEGLESLMLTNHRLAPATGLRHLAKLPKLHSLDISEPTSEEWSVPAEALAALHDFPALRRLVLSSNHFGGDAMVQVGHLTRLEHFELGANLVHNDDLTPLGRLVHLRKLRFDTPKFDTAGLIHLEPLQELEELVFWFLELDDRGLASIGKLSNLRKLKLRDYWVDAEGKPCNTRTDGDEDWRSITDAGIGHLSGLQRLVELDLSDLRLTDAALAHLAGMISLEMLDLTGNVGITGSGFTHLTRLPRLKTLKMERAHLEDAAIAQIANLPHLETLELYDCEAKATHAATRSLGQMTQLRVLKLTSWLLTDAALPPLRGLVHLEELDLGGSRLTDAAVPDLLALKSLKSLHVSGGTLSDVAKAELEAGLSAKIYWW